MAVYQSRSWKSAVVSSQRWRAVPNKLGVRNSPFDKQMKSEFCFMLVDSLDDDLVVLASRFEGTEEDNKRNPRWACEGKGRCSHECDVACGEMPNFDAKF